KADVARFRMRHQGVANGSARAGDEIYGFLGDAGFVKDVDEFGGNRGRIARGLQNHGVAGYERRRNQAGHDGAREIPRRNDHADAERNVYKIVALSAHRSQLLRLGQTKHLAAVELAEINRFGNVRVGFHPGFSDFVADQRIQLEFAFANDLRRAENALHALMGRNLFPNIEIRVRGFDGLLGHLRVGILEYADYLRGAGKGR